MLPKNYRSIYENFRDRLLTLADSIEELDPESRQQRFQEIQVFWRERILLLSDDNLTATAAARWQRLQTELLRSWRLLETDWLFLAASRQSPDRRLAAIRQRLAMLIEYCDVLLSETSEGEGD